MNDYTFASTSTPFILNPNPQLNPTSKPVSQPEPQAKFQMADVTAKINSAATAIRNQATKACQATGEQLNNAYDKVATMELAPIVQSTYEIGKNVEKGCNIGACVPIIGVTVSVIRMAIGKIQLAVAFPLMLIAKAAYLLSQKYDGDEKTLERWKTVSTLGTEHVMHGFLNISRGLSECLLWAATCGFGNVLLLAPNLSNEEPFAPVFNYGEFTKV